jgi:hypothetical protein
VGLLQCRDLGSELWRMAMSLLPILALLGPYAGTVGGLSVLEIP